MIAPGWREARRILAVRLDNLGDVLLASPALRAIRECLPAARLSLLAGPAGAPVGRLNPYVDEVITYRAPWVDPWQELAHECAREQRMVAALRERRFDAALIFTSYRQSALPAAYLCYLAAIPLRLAASDDACGSLLTTRHRHAVQQNGHVVHEVLRNLRLAGAVGIEAGTTELQLAVPPSAYRELGGLPAAIADASVGGRPLVVVHPGCSMPARTYPWPLFARAVEQLVEQLGATVALTGVTAERELSEAIGSRLAPAARPFVHDLAGRLSFGAFCALIERADAVVTNNTGPMHLAAALKTPVVALFALTVPPEQWRPWRVPHRLLFWEVECRLCYARVCPVAHDCLRRVPPAAVVDAVAELLAEGPPALPSRPERTVAAIEQGASQHEYLL